MDPTEYLRRYGIGAFSNSEERDRTARRLLADVGVPGVARLMHNTPGPFPRSKAPDERETRDWLREQDEPSNRRYWQGLSFRDPNPADAPEALDYSADRASGRVARGAPFLISAFTAAGGETSVAFNVTIAPPCKDLGLLVQDRANVGIIDWTNYSVGGMERTLGPFGALSAAPADLVNWLQAEGPGAAPLHVGDTDANTIIAVTVSCNALGAGNVIALYGVASAIGGTMAGDYFAATSGARFRRATW